MIDRSGNERYIQKLHMLAASCEKEGKELNGPASAIASMFSARFQTSYDPKCSGSSQTTNHERACSAPNVVCRFPSRTSNSCLHSAENKKDDPSNNGGINEGVVSLWNEEVRYQRYNATNEVSHSDCKG